MKSILKASELFTVACETCGCNDPKCGLQLNPMCHPGAPVRVKFFKATRRLDVTCDVCGQLVGGITELVPPS